MASTAHVGDTRALVFPVMSNGYLQLDYSEYSNSNYKHNLWGHKNEPFTFEAIVTPYDVNGVGHRTSGQGRLDSTKTPPSPNLSLDDHADATSNYQSVAYFGSGRNTHKMMLFYNPYFQFYLENTTTTNFNQPAEYKLVCKLVSGSTTHTVESDAVITASKKLKGYYDADGFYNGIITDKKKISSSATGSLPTATTTVSGNLASFTNTGATSATLGTATFTMNAQPGSSHLDVAGTSAAFASGAITFSSGWSITPITTSTAPSDNNAIILRNRQTGSGTSANKTYRFFCIDNSSSSGFPTDMQGASARSSNIDGIMGMTGGGLIADALLEAGYTPTDVFVPEVGLTSSGSSQNFRFMLTAAINSQNGVGSNPSSGLDITATTLNVTGVTGTISLTQDATGTAGNHSTTPNTGPVIGSSIANGGKLTATVFSGGTNATGASNVNYYMTVQLRNSIGNLVTKYFKFFSGIFTNGTLDTNSTTSVSPVHKVLIGGNTSVTASYLAGAINAAFSGTNFAGDQASVSGSVVTVTSPSTSTVTNQALARVSNYSSVVSVSGSQFANYVAATSGTTTTAFITLEDSAGLVKKYKPTKGDNSESNGSTATEGSNAVVFFTNVAGDTATTADNLRAVIAGSSGHNGSLTVSRSGSVVTIVAASAGDQAIASTGISSGLSLGTFSTDSQTITVSSGEADGIGIGAEIFDTTATLIGTVSSVTGNNIVLVANPATTVTSTIYTSQTKEALYLEQLNKLSCSFDKRNISIYVNNILVQRKRLDIRDFEFDDVDCYIGKDGTNSNTQFMGELYEVSMHKGMNPCPTISTLTPNFGDTLFYYTFGE